MSDKQKLPDGAYEWIVFTYGRRDLSEEQTRRCDMIRSLAIDLAVEIYAQMPLCEQAVKAFDHIRSAVLYACDGIAREDDPEEHDVREVC